MNKKIKKIIEDFKNKSNVLIAFSGGLDSSLLAYLAYKALNDKALAITVKTELIPKVELEESRQVAKEIGINQEIIEIDLLEDEKIKQNNQDRCYHCKKKLFKELIDFSSQHGFEEVIEGTNKSELGKEHRPGYKAIQELGICSPFVKYGVSQKEVREAAKKFNLSIHAKPSMACLASRISYKEEITEPKLQMIEEAEKIIHDLGFKQVRVRKHGDLARIEVSEEKRDLNKSKMNEITNKLKKLGFNYVTLDLEGYRTGKMEEDQDNR